MKPGIKRFWYCAFVVTGSLTAGVVLFVGSFIVTGFLWSLLAVPNPEDFGLGDGLMVVGGGFVIGCTLGVAAIVGVLYKFWPHPVSK
jgi:hypothetical protein